jgi:putative endonuclease
MPNNFRAVARFFKTRDGELGLAIRIPLSPLTISFLWEACSVFMYFVYILFSESANRFYIGQTNNVQQRLIRHNAAYEKATAPYCPWKLVCVIQKNTRSEAVILERKIKNLNTTGLKKFIEKYAP